MTEKTIILGSASPRRRELLAQIGAEFEVRVSNKEEVYHSNVPEEIVKELALMKAENVAEELASLVRIRSLCRTGRSWENRRTKRMRCGC